MRVAGATNVRMEEPCARRNTDSKRVAAASEIHRYNWSSTLAARDA